MISKMRDCVVELVGFGPTTRVLWNIVVSDQLPWSDTHPDRRRRAKATWPRRGAAVRTTVRPGYLVGLEPCSITFWWLMKYQKARKIVDQRHFRLRSGGLLCPGSLRLAQEKCGRRAGRESFVYWVGLLALVRQGENRIVKVEKR